MPALVDAREAKAPGLLDLPVDEAVQGGDVGVAGRGEAGGVDEVGDGLAAEPVAVVVGVAGEEDDVDALLQEGGDVLEGGVLPAVVAGGAEGHDVGDFGEVLEGADGSLDFARVEVVDVELGGEGVGVELADVVLVAVEVDVVEGFDLAGAEGVGVAADFVGAAEGAVGDLVDAVARAVEAVVELGAEGGVEGAVVVGVAGEDGEVVVGLVLDQGIVPAVADEHGL